MSIPMNDQCWVCQLKRYTEQAKAAAGEEAAKAVGRGIMELLLAAPKDAGTPWMGPHATELLRVHCGITGDRYAEEKALSNRFVVERMDALRSRLESAEDPVYRGLQYAIFGNYLDFPALQGQVSFEKLDALLDGAGDMALDTAVYDKFCRELSRGKRFLMVTDNAGEIGFDRLLAEQIHARYPHLEITFCVRGGNAANDATREDARAVGVPFPVIDNGTCIAGTELALIGQKAKQALETADVILSKGLGNVESLLGCGLPVFYAFLIKCQRFVDLMGKPMLTPMFLSER